MRLKETLGSKDLEACYQMIVESERRIIASQELPPCQSSGILPEIAVNGQKWYEWIRRLNKNPVRILDLGAGDDCGAWTGGLGKKPIHPEILRLKKDGVNFHVTAQSGRNNLKGLIESSGIDRFIAGHFIDALQTLKSEGQTFDIILSRWALYHTVTLFEILQRVDNLLVEGGAAFLETIYRGAGNTSALIFDPFFIPKGLLNHFLIYELSLSPYQARVGELPIIEEEGSQNHVAWIKGRLNKNKLPKFTGISQFEEGFDLWYGLFESSCDVFL